MQHETKGIDKIDIREDEQFTLKSKEERLYMEYGKYDLELVPRAEDKFDLIGFSPIVKYEFKFKENGEVESALMYQKKQGIFKNMIRINNTETIDD